MSSDDDGVPEFFIGAALGLVLLGGAGGFLTWLAGQLTALLTGGGWPDSSPADCLEIAFRFVQHPGDPAAAWPVAAAASIPAPLFFVLFVVLLALLAAVGYVVVRFYLNFRRHRPVRRMRLGFASGWEVRKLLSARTVLEKAPMVRPSIAGRPDTKPEDVGFLIGRDIRSRRKLYASAEDTATIVAAPRQGKDVHFVTPFTLDAPGPCIVTSTHRETFVHTAMMRAQVGEVYVFDPYRFTAWPNRLRWSPLQGCEDPNVCAVRTGTLVAESGFKVGVEGSTALGGVITLLRCLFYAGGIGQVEFRDLMRWIYEGNADEPMDILRQGERDGRVAPGFSSQLEFNRNDDRIWSGAVQVMSCFEDPRVLEDCSPPRGEEFDFKTFLQGRNTLYFIGKQQTDHGGIAPIVTVMFEQFIRSARGAAMGRPNGRLDPPLTFELNQVTDLCPLGGLPTYMGESGGYGITLHVYLTSLAEARAKWGADGAAKLWDNSSFRIISGGTGTAKDLEELSDLVGKQHGEAALRPEELRTMPFGRAAVVAGTARPVEMWLTPWWKRKDRDEIARGKAAVEKMLADYTSDQDYAGATTVAAGPRARAVPDTTALPDTTAVPGATNVPDDEDPWVI